MATAGSSSPGGGLRFEPNFRIGLKRGGSLGSEGTARDVAPDSAT